MYFLRVVKTLENMYFGVFCMNVIMNQAFANLLTEMDNGAYHYMVCFILDAHKLVQIYFSV